MRGGMGIGSGHGYAAGTSSAAAVCILEQYDADPAAWIAECQRAHLAPEAPAA